MVLSANLALILAAYVAAGLFTGVVAGLLGIGGGLLMIPLLNALFAAQGVAAEQIQHLALGTSLAAIVPTSMLSCRAHAQRGAVEWPAVRRMAPWIISGTLLAGLAARGLSSLVLQGFYVGLCGWVLYTLLRPTSATELTPRPLGHWRVAGAGIGLLSGLLGIGGGSLSTPYLLQHGRDIRQAVGTAAALGVPIAVAGALAYGLSGIGVPGRSASALGFVDLLAVAGLVAGSALSTAHGVALAHRLPRPVLRRLFALMILLAGIKMVWLMIASG